MLGRSRRHFLDCRQIWDFCLVNSIESNWIVSTVFLLRCRQLHLNCVSTVGNYFNFVRRQNSWKGFCVICPAKSIVGRCCLKRQLIDPTNPVTKQTCIFVMDSRFTSSQISRAKAMNYGLVWRHIVVWVEMVSHRGGDPWTARTVPCETDEWVEWERRAVSGG